VKTALAGPRHWATVLLVALGLAALYAGAVRAPFLNDDYLFLEEARSRGLASSLSDLGPLGNYYRPLSRQIYFAALAPIAGGHPAVFHAFNFALFLGALALLADLLRSALPRAGVLAGVLYFALIPFQRVNLTWISCSQDLLALTGTLAALALHRRGRTIAALACFVAALASKESALALPAALVAWDRWIDRRAWPATLRRVTPFGVAALAWVVVSLVMRARHAAAHRSTVAAGLRRRVRAFGAELLGLDHPAGWMSSLATHGPELLPRLLPTAAFLIGESASNSPSGPRPFAALGLIWLSPSPSRPGPCPTPGAPTTPRWPPSAPRFWSASPARVPTAGCCSGWRPGWSGGTPPAPARERSRSLRAGGAGLRT
jgi:hypothetical protein